MQTAALYSIGQNKGQPRVWMQGNRPKKAGFEPGVQYEIDVQVTKNMIVLSVSDKGSHVVSKKPKKNGEFDPVIDLNSEKVLGMFKDMKVVRAIMTPKKIYILPPASEIRKKDRLDRLKSKLEKSEALTELSFSHGAGVLSDTFKEGMDEAGVPVKLAGANDISGDMLEQAENVNLAFDPETKVLQMPLQELAFDEYVMSKLGTCDVITAGLPCSGASVAGRAKRKLSHPEDHPLVGHLVASFVAVVAKLNPSIVLFENVVPYASSASMSIMRNHFRDHGYICHEMIVDSSEYGVFEKRKRLATVFVTEGLHFDPADIEIPEWEPTTLGQIMEDMSDDDPRWSSMPGLRAKELRDKAAGKGFSMQIYDVDAQSCGTLTKDLAKNRSTDPKWRNPRTGLLRVPTTIEHARAKGIDERFVEGLSQTFGHQCLGQSITPAPFKAISKAIAKMCRRFLEVGLIAPPRVLDEEGEEEVQHDLLAAVG